MRRALFPMMLLALLAAALLPATGAGATTTGGDDCAAPDASPTFEMGYIDETRAGGEPLVARHPDGQLLWGSHAGTTHFYSPTAASPSTSAFVENYQGQTYYYVSEDGDEWSFVPRTPVAESEAAQLAGVPATGFSDPEFAIDQAGNVFVSEINLANVAVSKSTDGGRTYGLVNVFSFTSSDRQWMAADREDELYMTANGFGGGSFPASPIGNVGHFMAKSTDGGLTFGAASTTNPNGVGDIQIDHDRGILYEMSATSDTISIARFANIREEETDFTVEIFEIDGDVSLSGVQRLIDPTFDMDSDGNLYVTYTDNPDGDADAQGIFYAYSTDQGETWSTPQKVDADANDDIWPWITVGEPGKVAVTWLQSSEATADQLGGEAGGADAEWNVMVATTETGLGCDGGEAAGFRLTQASSEPVHTGTICQQGTVCQAQAIDRRLGDYFSIETSSDGTLDVAISDTRQGGAVALPLHIRQTGGPTLGAPDPVEDSSAEGGAADDGSDGDSTSGAATDDDGDGGVATAADPSTDGGQLANTGGGVGLAAALLAGVALVRRRRD